MMNDWNNRARHLIVNDWVDQDQKGSPMILTFKNDLSYIVDYNGDGQRDIWGQYQLRRNRIRMDYEDATHYTECYTPGIYTYRIKNGKLHFKVVADQCRPRKLALGRVRIKKSD